MNNQSDTKRLAEAVTNIALSITEIIEAKIKELADASKVVESNHPFSKLTPAEGWWTRRRSRNI